MEKIDGFEKLECWQSARVLVSLVYTACNDGPLSRDFDTRSQFRRAALSVMNNIAEGFGRATDREVIRFLDIAQSSAMEVKSIGYVLIDQNYLPIETVELIQTTAERTKRMIRGLMRYRRSRLQGGPPPSHSAPRPFIP